MNHIFGFHLIVPNIGIYDIIIYSISHLFKQIVMSPSNLTKTNQYYKTCSKQKNLPKRKVSLLNKILEILVIS